MKKAKPCDFELGNLFFNHNNTQSYILPRYAGVLMNDIRERLDNILGVEGNPFGNTGEKFKIDDVFEVEAYNWNDDYKQPYNFKYKNIEINWYKYLGRDTTINGNYTPEEIIKMYDDCVDAINDYAKNHKIGEDEDVWI